jgi:hypothetical protein
MLLLLLLLCCISCSLFTTMIRLTVSLTLESNGLVGTVPTELALLTTLMSLKINLNDMTGSIPTGMCNNVLQVLDTDCAVTCDCCDWCEPLLPP